MLRVQLPVLDVDDVAELLDYVTDLDGVVAALVDERAATLDVVLATEASSLLVREQLLTFGQGVASA